MRRVLLYFVAVGLGPSGVAAQSVTVRAVETETKRPVAGAIISLVDRAERRVVQALTNETGRVVLRAPSPGEFRVRADRIGYAGVWTAFFALADSLTLSVEMPGERVMLPEITVRGSNQCGVRPDGAETVALWEEIRKALSAGQLTAESQSVELSVRRFRRARLLSGAVRFDSTVREYRTRVSPFVSPAPSLLAAEGYIREVGQGFQFHGPDALTLLSDSFLESHCFRLAKPAKEMPGAVGLAFQPVKGVDRPDVRGTLWVDSNSLELRVLEFEFVKAPAAVQAPGIGGRVEFARLSNGAWIVSDWYIRAPDRIAILGRGARRTDRSVRDSLIGYLDEGGTARPVGDLTIALGEAVSRTAATTTVWGDFRGRVVGPSGAPVADADVAVAEVDTVLQTDAAGRFEVKNLPVGKLSVRIRAIGYRPLGMGFVLASGRRLVDTTIVLQKIQVLDSVVVTAKAPEFISGKMIDVERRRAAGFGRFLTRKELHDPLTGGLEMKLRRFARMRVAPLCQGKGYGAAAAFHGPPPTPVNCGDSKLLDCFMAVYLDGALYWSPDMGDVQQPPDVSKFNPLDYETIEVYRSPAETPIEYTGPAAGCGVILLWTRVG